MRAAYFRGDGVIELADAPIPQPIAGQLLLQVAGNGLCGSDIKILERGHDRIPGHEVAGTVVEAGPGCQTPVGSRVAVYVPMHCGVCAYCRRGSGNLCPHREGILGAATDGGYAEYMLVPDRNALLLADGVSFAAGVALLDTLGTSGHALRLARCREAETLLVIGAGPIGIGAVAMARAMGVPNIYVSEPSAYRREQAAGMGAITIDPHHEVLEERIRDAHPHGVDRVLEAVGSPPTLFQALDLVAPGGTVSLVGEHWGKYELDRPKAAWMLNDIHVIRSFYFTIPEFHENQQMVREGKVDAAALVSHTYPLTAVRQAYDAFRAGETLKVLVEP